MGEANAVKVRRVMQLVTDLTPRPFEELRILDLGCGEGVYAIEAGLRGAKVLAIDARTERMELGDACAQRHGLDNVTFRQEDARRDARRPTGASRSSSASACCTTWRGGDPPVPRARPRPCGGLLVIDTMVSLETGRGGRPRGGSTAATVSRARGRRLTGDATGRLLGSVDTTFAFRLTLDSLVRALHDAGFSSAFECHAPLEPGKAESRVTLAALKGDGVAVLSTYPWVNGPVRGRDRSAAAPMSTAPVAVFAMIEHGHFDRLRPLIGGLADRGVPGPRVSPTSGSGTRPRPRARLRGPVSRYPLDQADDASVPFPCRFVSFAADYADRVIDDLEAIGPSLVVYDTFAVVGHVVALALGFPT